MLKLNVNLSSNPFVNRRKFYLTVTVLLMVLAGAAYWNASQYIRVHSRKTALDQMVADKRAQLEKLEQEEQAIRARLLRPETADFLDRVEYVNSLIDRRTFSWTRLLNDLERLIPANVQVVSVRPRILKGEFGIELTANARTSGDFIEFLTNLETSEEFTEVTPIYEDVSKTPGFVGKQISIAVKYKGKV